MSGSSLGRAFVVVCGLALSGAAEAFTCDLKASASATVTGNMNAVELPLCLAKQFDARAGKERDDYVADVKDALKTVTDKVAGQDKEIQKLSPAAAAAIADMGLRDDKQVAAIQAFQKAKALRIQYAEVQSALERIVRATEEAAPCDPKKLASAIPVTSGGNANRAYTACARAQFAARDTAGKIEYVKDIQDKALFAVQKERRAAAAKVKALESQRAKKAQSTTSTKEAQSTTSTKEGAPQSTADTNSPADDADANSELKVFEEMEGVLYALVEGSDPVALKLDFFAETRYSSLNKDKDAAFFSKATPRFTLEVRQLLADPRRLTGRKGEDCSKRDCFWQLNNFETYGFIAFDDSAVESVTDANGLQTITTSGRFIVEGGLVWRPLRIAGGQLSLGLEGAVGLNGYSKTIPKSSPDNGLAAQKEDFYKGRYKLGIQLRQEGGDLEGTTTEVAYLRDPMFEERDRWLVRGRLVVNPVLLGVGGLGLYIEGSFEEGGGRDGSAIAVGLKLNTLAVLRAVTGQK